MPRKAKAKAETKASEAKTVELVQELGGVKEARLP
jgi:hypothetical protein